MAAMQTGDPLHDDDAAQLRVQLEQERKRYAELVDWIRQSSLDQTVLSSVDGTSDATTSLYLRSPLNESLSALEPQHAGPPPAMRDPYEEAGTGGGYPDQHQHSPPPQQSGGEVYTSSVERTVPQVGRDAASPPMAIDTAREPQPPSAEIFLLDSPTGEFDGTIPLSAVPHAALEIPILRATGNGTGTDISSSVASPNALAKSGATVPMTHSQTRENMHDMLHEVDSAIETKSPVEKAAKARKAPAGKPARPAARTIAQSPGHTHNGGGGRGAGAAAARDDPHSDTFGAMVASVNSENFDPRALRGDASTGLEGKTGKSTGKNGKRGGSASSTPRGGAGGRATAAPADASSAPLKFKTRQPPQLRTAMSDTTSAFSSRAGGSRPSASETSAPPQVLGGRRGRGGAGPPGSSVSTGRSPLDFSRGLQGQMGAGMTLPASRSSRVEKIADTTTPLGAGGVSKSEATAPQGSPMPTPPSQPLQPADVISDDLSGDGCTPTIGWSAGQCASADASPRNVARVAARTHPRQDEFGRAPTTAEGGIRSGSAGGAAAAAAAAAHELGGPKGAEEEEEDHDEQDIAALAADHLVALAETIEKRRLFSPTKSSYAAVAGQGPAGAHVHARGFDDVDEDDDDDDDRAATIAVRDPQAGADIVGKCVVAVADERKPSGEGASPVRSTVLALPPSTADVDADAGRGAGGADPDALAAAVAAAAAAMAAEADREVSVSPNACVAAIDAMEDAELPVAEVAREDDDDGAANAAAADEEQTAPAAAEAPPARHASTSAERAAAAPTSGSGGYVVTPPRVEAADPRTRRAAAARGVAPMAVTRGAGGGFNVVDLHKVLSAAAPVPAYAAARTGVPLSAAPASARTVSERSYSPPPPARAGAGLGTPRSGTDASTATTGRAGSRSVGGGGVPVVYTGTRIASASGGGVRRASMSPPQGSFGGSGAGPSRELIMNSGQTRHSGFGLRKPPAVTMPSDRPRTPPSSAGGRRAPARASASPVAVKVDPNAPDNSGAQRRKPGVSSLGLSAVVGSGTRRASPSGAGSGRAKSKSPSPDAGAVARKSGGSAGGAQVHAAEVVQTPAPAVKGRVRSRSGPSGAGGRSVSFSKEVLNSTSGGGGYSSTAALHPTATASTVYQGPAATVATSEGVFYSQALGARAAAGRVASKSTPPPPRGRVTPHGAQRTMKAAIARKVAMSAELQTRRNQQILVEQRAALAQVLPPTNGYCRGHEYRWVPPYLAARGAPPARSGGHVRSPSAPLPQRPLLHVNDPALSPAGTGARPGAH